MEALRNQLFAAWNSSRLPDGTPNFAAPTWFVLGNNVPDSSLDFDTTIETITDILLTTRTRVQNQVLSQSFEAPLDTDSPLDEWLDELFARGPAGLPLMSRHDCLIALGWRPEGPPGGMLAKRFMSSTIVRGMGGPGDGNVTVATHDITFGGEEVRGSVNATHGSHLMPLVFTPSV